MRSRRRFRWGAPWLRTLRVVAEYCFLGAFAPDAAEERPFADPPFADPPFDEPSEPRDEELRDDEPPDDDVREDERDEFVDDRCFDDFPAGAFFDADFFRP